MYTLLAILLYSFENVDERIIHSAVVSYHIAELNYSDERLVH